MKYINKTIILGLLITVFVNEKTQGQNTPLGDNTNYNHVYTILPQIPVTNKSGLTENEDAVKNITFFDELGRPNQQIAIKQSPNEKDIVTTIVYDEFGRQKKQYLPYVSTTNTGQFKTDALSQTINYYTTHYASDINYNAPNPYSEVEYDGSPLNRVVKKAAPGYDWRLGGGHEISMEYLTNTSQEVRRYYVTTQNIANTYIPTLKLPQLSSKTPESSSIYNASNEQNVNTVSYNNTQNTSAVATQAPASGSTNSQNVVSASTPPLSSSIAYYKAGELYKTIVKNENFDRSTETRSQDGKNSTEDVVTVENGVVTVSSSVDNTSDSEPAKNNTTEEYKNKQGQLILKRVYNNNVQYDTYYIYDTYGNLSFVLPPKVNAHNSKPNANQLSELCYQYRYDTKNRLVQKKVPGKAWEYIIYDKLHRPVLTQDAQLRTQNKWLFTKYDILGRVIYTGIYTHTSSLTQEQMQAHLNASNTTATSQYETKLSTPSSGGLPIYYSHTNFPYVNINILTIQYYDNYIFNKGTALSSVTTSYGENSTTNVKGLPTGTKVKILGTTQWETQVLYYDDRARIIYTHTHNGYLNTTNLSEMDLDFVGKPLETTTTHKKTTHSDLLVRDLYTYDHTGRMLTHKQQINSQPQELIAQYVYDSLGNVKTKHVGNTTDEPLQDVDYSYNIRGWLKRINSDSKSDNDLFNFELKYNDIAQVSKRLYNGNISQTTWNTLSTNTSLNPESTTYTYTYDHINRIKSAIDNTGHYDLTNITYDKNGNILTLQRKGQTNALATTFGIMDDLTYTYDSGNKLLKVTDAAPIDAFGFKDDAHNLALDTEDDYAYDANGNLLSDANKDITSILYNHLNLVTEVEFSNTNKINYIYTALGTKISKEVDIGSSLDVTSYVKGFIYKNDVLEFFNHSEGYVTSNSGVYDYVYQYKDHLGNIRLSYTDEDKDGEIEVTTEIVKESNYYPFGLKHKGYNNISSSYGNSSAEKFGFNSKENNDELGLEWQDFGARNYEASLGRWMNVDPLASKMYSWSPYNYTFNNPINYIDPNGKEPIVINGKLVGYRVEEGQGPTQIAKDLNESGLLSTFVSFQDVVIGDIGYFSNVIEGDINNVEYTELNMNSGDILSLSKILMEEEGEELKNRLILFNNQLISSISGSIDSANDVLKRKEHSHKTYSSFINNYSADHNARSGAKGARRGASRVIETVEKDIKRTTRMKSKLEEKRDSILKVNVELQKGVIENIVEPFEEIKQEFEEYFDSDIPF